MRGLLFLGVLLALLWVGWNKVQEIQAVQGADGQRLDLGLPSESTSASRFQEQYLCEDLSGDGWAMFEDRNASFAAECSGPFIDGRNLCAAMSRIGLESIELYGEGRTLRCE